MTTPADPDRPDNGNSSGLPNYPSAPPPSEYETAVFTPPTEIIASFWCYVVAAVIVLVGGLLFSGYKQQVLDTLRAKNTTNLTETQLNSLATATVAFAVAFAVIIAALYLLFAFKLRAGRNWARIVLTVVAALDLLTIVTGRGGTAVGYIGALAAVIGCVLSYVPKSSTYIAAVKASRQLR